jgi:hypothetical protein
VFIIYLNESCDSHDSCESCESCDTNIPKKIWTFWDGEKPSFVDKCIDSWKKYNPDYEIIVLNKKNIHEYLPNLDMNFKHVDDVRHFSDIIRICILAEHGGIWSDASVICYGSYDWIIEVQQEKELEFVGFWIHDDLKDSPSIENWFFAVQQNSIMVNDWKDALMDSQNYNTKEEYINMLKENYNLDQINDPTYLWMHAAMQKILQDKKNNYKYEVYPARDGPFKYLQENDWEPDKGINDLINCVKDKNCESKYNSFVKFTGYGRNFVNSDNEDLLFY